MIKYLLLISVSLVSAAIILLCFGVENKDLIAGILGCSAGLMVVSLAITIGLIK